MRKYQIRKSCIGFKTLANPSGKCTGERLHSYKYNGKKLYCDDCIAFLCERMRARALDIKLAVR